MNDSILSGVSVWNGAVIAAYSLVTKNVPPYSILAGNPARAVKMRFTNDEIDKLLKISWWNWHQPEIEQAVPYMLSSDISEFIRYCERLGKVQ